MVSTVVTGVMLPFIGTALGSGAVFFVKKHRGIALTDCLSGFAGGVMLAASLWSLLLPSIEEGATLGRLSFVPSAVGFMIGIAFMLLCERLIERLETDNGTVNFRSRLTTAFAVTVHNFPEGLAVGLVYATLMDNNNPVAVAGAISLSLGIAVQNIPEGAIVSLPLYSDRGGRVKPFLYGVLSGAVEPIAAVTAILCVSFFSPLMAYFLSFAAGTMIFVVMEELADEMHGKRGMLFFALGFVVMMSLDVALG